MSFIVFDIETRIDKTLLRDTMFPGQALSDEEAHRRARAALSEQTGNDFLPLTYHVPVSIVTGHVRGDHVLQNIDVARADERGEAGLVREFWHRLEAFEGTLVSFNGRGFDLPVLELQALRWGCSAPKYFNQRDGFRARYGRHYDLYDFLTNSGATRLRGGLDLLAKLAGLPGKSGVAGADVQGLWEAGRFDEIHAYCRRDVIQTYYLFLHVELLRGRMSAERLRSVEQETQRFHAEISGGP
jgi:predicted PolB exonuclease-like 3'-5' exonuclease